MKWWKVCVCYYKVFFYICLCFSVFSYCCCIKGLLFMCNNGVGKMICRVCVICCWKKVCFIKFWVSILLLLVIYKVEKLVYYMCMILFVYFLIYLLLKLSCKLLMLLMCCYGVKRWWVINYLYLIMWRDGCFKDGKWCSRVCLWINWWYWLIIL